jgi:hypothetical protein
MRIGMPYGRRGIKSPLAQSHEAALFLQMVYIRIAAKRQAVLRPTYRHTYHCWQPQQPATRRSGCYPSYRPVVPPSRSSPTLIKRHQCTPPCSCLEICGSALTGYHLHPFAAVNPRQSAATSTCALPGITRLKGDDLPLPFIIIFTRQPAINHSPRLRRCTCSCGRIDQSARRRYIIFTHSARRISR